MKKYLNKIHYSKSLCLGEKFFRGILAIFSLIYLACINIRNLLYNKGLLHKAKLPAYVISIGNLTTGGTGKTPVTIEIARYIKNILNKKAVVLSHGYGGKLPVKEINIISDGKNINYNSHQAGDEPYLMATKLKDTPVITGKNRINNGKYAIENFKADILILDDGFQHVKLERDLNILVIDCNKEFGNKMLLPAGPLREPVSEIKRADRIIVVNKKPYDENSKESCRQLTENLKKKTGKHVVSCNFKYGKIQGINNMEILNPSRKVFAFTGIAQPEFFFNYLTEQNLNIAGTKEFTDHHIYTKNDVKNIVKKAKKLAVQAIVTTEKDSVKLIPVIKEIGVEIPFFELKLEVEIDLESLLGSTLKPYD